MNKSKLLIALVAMSSSVAFAGGTVHRAPYEAPAEVAPAPAPAPVPAEVAPAPVAAPVAVAPAFVPSWYVGAGVGRAKANGTSDTSEKVYAGYRFHPNFAAEATYNRFGSNVKGGSIDALGIIPVGYNVDLFGKVGVADTHVDGFGSKTGANYGVGAAYHFTPNWSARAEAERFQKVDNAGDSLNNYSISAQYNF